MMECQTIARLLQMLAQSRGIAEDKLYISAMPELLNEGTTYYAVFCATALTFRTADPLEMANWLTKLTVLPDVVGRFREEEEEVSLLPE